MTLYTNITSHITNNTVLNLDNDKYVSNQLFHIAFEIYNSDPLMRYSF